MKWGRYVVAAVWLYAALILTWLLLRTWLGDTLWWLALLNAFVPFLFAPLVIFLPLGLLIRRRAFWLGAAIPTTVFLLLYGGQFAPRPNHFIEEDETFSLMTFNVWGWSQSPETAHVISAEGLPDIVVLQELTPEMAEIVLAEVEEAYPYRLLETKAGHRGMGILSRYPLEARDADDLSSPWWRMQVAEVQIGARDFTLYHCHPEGTNVLYFVEAQLAVSEEVMASFAARERMMEALKADIEARGQAVIVAGDFNTTDQSEAYRILTQDLREAHHAVGWGFGHTFPAYRGSYRGVPIPARLMRLDMVFHTRDLMALSSRIGTAHGESDHLPVIVKIKWRE